MNCKTVCAITKEYSFSRTEQTHTSNTFVPRIRKIFPGTLILRRGHKLASTPPDLTLMSFAGWVNEKVVRGTVFTIFGKIGQKYRFLDSKKQFFGFFFQTVEPKIKVVCFNK